LTTAIKATLTGLPAALKRLQSSLQALFDRIADQVEQYNTLRNAPLPLRLMLLFPLTEDPVLPSARPVRPKQRDFSKAGSRKVGGLDTCHVVFTYPFKKQYHHFETPICPFEIQVKKFFASQKQTPHKSKDPCGVFFSIKLTRGD
jgi:hypothetical protein